jgi:hypothetical protein
MAGELEAALRKMFSAIDQGDMEQATSMFGADAEGIDEVSRRWMRGQAFVTYVHDMAKAIDDIRTELRDVHEREWTDTGLVTCWLEQDYTLEGKPTHVSAPTTALFQRDGEDWRLALFHSVTLAQ